MAIKIRFLRLRLPHILKSYAADQTVAVYIGRRGIQAEVHALHNSGSH